MHALRLLALAPFFQGSWAQCSGSFDAISASDFVARITPGWNLGNTLDAVPNEGSWNNPPVEESTFDYVKSAGFKSVRLPVTWTHHFTGGAPDWPVDPTWLQRVSDVIDMITSRGLYTIVNVHHDSWEWADVTKPDANMTEIEEKFSKLWYQIGAKLGCKSSLVAFESINEPPCNTAEDGAKINRLNAIFLEAINSAGGFNTQRVVNLVGGGMDSVKTSQWFKAPANIINPWALQFHFYSPYNFIFSAWGKTIWGSDSDKSELESAIELLRGNFTDVPIVLGEFDASPANTEPAARWKYHDYLIRTARKYNISPILWDNGADHLDRSSGIWRDPTSMEIFTNGDETNSLPDSTEDAAASSQWSSAYIFHKVGTQVTDQTLPFLFNGNTLVSIKDSTGTTLQPGTDYTVSGSNIAFPASFLSTYYSETSEPGLLANFTLEFSSGASPVIQLVQWDTPTLSSTSAAASSVSGSDLSIPITWKGIPKPATVKALLSDGRYLMDDFTRWFGPLQQARTTYSNQWNSNAENVVLTRAVIDAVVAAGQDTVFTFEFYPRVDATTNTVNFTLTV
ncbi:glycoside hydrolase superfamily [Aspergillus coremiiformis]|uniref:Glycoside hydrolase superfamily n=1 Tax=Aspergillus coremiiformis TaxID=138285 RepID=A0A5N6ZBN5_9EURO|nr:glycoside hydrolase superfamily [Aspergillus coremiiformis]